MRTCNTCATGHPWFLPHEEQLRYIKLWADIIIAAGILLLVAIAIRKRGLVKTATAKVG